MSHLQQLCRTARPPPPVAQAVFPAQAARPAPETSAKLLRRAPEVRQIRGRRGHLAARAGGRWRLHHCAGQVAAPRRQAGRARPNAWTLPFYLAWGTTSAAQELASPTPDTAPAIFRASCRGLLVSGQARPVECLQATGGAGGERGRRAAIAVCGWRGWAEEAGFDGHSQWAGVVYKRSGGAGWVGIVDGGGRFVMPTFVEM